mmetsp:Transcript_23925/g.20360  ORF Transcript_23925/g.20360 Transcript_23925/m.20360 type:complete len:108 (-) Transcript_23925:39-362(-)
MGLPLGVVLVLRVCPLVPSLLFLLANLQPAKSFGIIKLMIVGYVPMGKVMMARACEDAAEYQQNSHNAAAATITRGSLCYSEWITTQWARNYSTNTQSFPFVIPALR